MPENASDVLNLRRDLRVAGPFDGRWVDLLTVPLRIHDLSIGGCLIQAYHEQAPGRRFTLEIELPDEGWIEMEAESIYVREGYGFAARFVDMDDETRDILEGFIRRQSRLERTQKSPSL